MSIGRLIFNIIMALLLCAASIFGHYITDFFLIGILVILELMAFIVLFVPCAGTFLFRITGIEGLGDCGTIDVYLADGFLHKLISFVIIQAVISGIGGLYLSIPEEIRAILGMGIMIFIISVSIKAESSKFSFSDEQRLISDFVPTVCAIGIAIYAICCYTVIPTFIGSIIVCITAGLYVFRGIRALNW